MKFIKSLIVFSLVFAASMLTLEFYLHLAEIQTPMETRIDSVIGPTYIPNFKVTRFNEGFHIGDTNAYGYLGQESPRQRVADEYRILMLGDSYVMGNTMFERHHFIHIVERELSRESGRRVDAMNFGKADFALANMYTYYRDFASEFEHDLALFFVDIQDLTPSRQIERDLYPVCQLESDSLVIDYGFNQSPKYQAYKKIELISEHSSFFRLAYNTRKVFYRGEFAKMMLDKFHPLLFPQYKPKKYQEPEVMALSETVTAILRELAADPKNMIVYRDVVPQALMDEVAATGIRTLDLAPLLQRLEDEGRNPFLWKVTGKTGHWNHDTQEEIGSLISQSLVDRVTADSSS
jgi:hypothetical protein